MRRLLILAIALAALLLGLLFVWQPAPAVKAPVGGDFTLQSAHGPVSLQDLRGKVVLIYFGYTYCPDICPTSLAATADGLRQLRPEELARVVVLFVSVDPERDTPARLQEYAAFFHPNITGVTGTPAALAEVAARYGAFYARQSVDTAGGYVVDHTGDTYVVDAAGRLQAKIPHAAPPTAVAATIRTYLP